MKQMPRDNKYGKVTLEHGEHIPDDEPGVWFRAKDKHLDAVLEFYHQLCSNDSPEHHLAAINNAGRFIHDWQVENGTVTPRSDEYAKRIGIDDE